MKSSNSSFKKYSRVLLQALVLFLIGAVLASAAYLLLEAPYHNLVSLCCLTLGWIAAGVLSIRFYKKEVERGVLLEKAQEI